MSRMCAVAAGLVAALAGVAVAGPDGTAGQASRRVEQTVQIPGLGILHVTPKGVRPPAEPPPERCNIVSNLCDANFDGGSYVLQQGMAQGEMFAATYTLQAADFPIRHQLTEVIIGCANTTVQTHMEWSLLFYQGEPNTGTLVDVFSSDGTLLPHVDLPAGTNGVNLQFSIDPGDPEQLIINDDGTHKFTVAFRIDRLNQPSANPCSTPSPANRNCWLATDTGGLQNSSANWLYGLNCGAFGCPANGGWSKFSLLPAFCRPSGDWVSRTTWSSVNCTPGVGGCCLPDGSCQVMTTSECQNAGGTFRGDGTTCDGANCPQPTGACCFPNGFCSVVPISVCNGAGGFFAGPNTSCGAGNTCPTGACCLPNGSCQGGLTEGQCTAQGGTFRGIGSQCAGQNCPQPEGACCFPNGFCASLTESVCAGAGGTWSGMGTTCADLNQNGHADVCEHACRADFNDDGFLDFFDADAFVACYEGIDCPPGKNCDYNGDLFCDFFDIDQFVADFEAGC